MIGAFSTVGWLQSAPKYTSSDSNLHLPDTLKLQSGDLVFREGIGYISRTLKQFNRADKRFSHAGIIHIQDNEAFVYHCIGGEGNPDNRMKMEKLSSFCASKEALAFGIYRPDLSASLSKAVDSLATSYWRKGLEFDTHFDLESNDKMYCTELIYKIYDEVLRENNFVPLTSISGTTYVSCDNIFMQKQVKELFTFTYKTSGSSQTNFHEEAPR